MDDVCNSFFLFVFEECEWFFEIIVMEMMNYVLLSINIMNGLIYEMLNR